MQHLLWNWYFLDKTFPWVFRQILLSLLWIHQPEECQAPGLAGRGQSCINLEDHQPPPGSSSIRIRMFELYCFPMENPTLPLHYFDLPLPWLKVGRNWERDSVGRKISLTNNKEQGTGARRETWITPIPIFFFKSNFYLSISPFFFLSKQAHKLQLTK